MGSFAVDGDLTVVFWNSAMEGWTKIPRQEITGKNIAVYYPSLLETKRLNRIMDVMRTGAPALFSTQIHGHIIPIPVRDGGFRAQQTIALQLVSPDTGPLALFMINDLTDMTAKIAAYRDMRDQAMRAANDLRVEKERAEGATRLKDKFVALVAHDLKSPISSIIGLTRIIIDDRLSPPIPRHREILEQALKSCLIMTQMIDELLNLNRLQTGSIQPHPRFINPRLAVQITLDIFSTNAMEKGITLTNNVNPSGRIYADPALFDEVIRNLVSNAVKFCRSGDRVEVYTPEHSFSSVAVRDTGVGVDAYVLPHLFRHEVKTSLPGTSGERGTGLGLPYCHEIMAAHGGTITVETVEEKGSVFYVTFPDITPLILIVDADTTRSDAVRKKLETSLDATVAESARLSDASEALKGKAPHLVIYALSAGEKGPPAGILELGGDDDARTLSVIVVAPDGFVAGEKIKADGWIAESRIMDEISEKAGRLL